MARSVFWVPQFGLSHPRRSLKLIQRVFFAFSAISPPILPERLELNTRQTCGSPRGETHYFKLKQ
jgi:hypothetical protein